MKILPHIIIFSLSVFLISAKAEDIPESNLLGKWKLEATKFSDEPLLPAWMSFAGEAKFKNDRSFHFWMQSQSDPSGRILALEGTWSLKNDTLMLKKKETGESLTVSVENKSNVMIFKGFEPFPKDLHFKKMEPSDPNQVEGLKFDYMIAFPKEWNLYTPDMVDIVSEDNRSPLEQLKCRAFAQSPDKSAQVMLNVSSRHLSCDELDIKSNSDMTSLGVNTITIGDTVWRIQKTWTPHMQVYGFSASTYHNYKTVRLIFHFHKDYPNPKSAFDYVLNSFEIFGSEENNDLKYGIITNHTCGKPVFYHCGDSTNSYMHFLYSDIGCPHCGDIWPRKKDTGNHPSDADLKIEN